MSRHSSTDPTPGGDSDKLPIGVAIALTAKEVKPGRNTYDGQDEPQFEVIWATADDTWVYDWVSPTHVRDNKGTPSKAKQLAASLAGRIPLQVANVWWDDESGEYGFDSQKAEVAGRLTPGVRVMAELWRKVDSKTGTARLRVARYLPAGQQAAPAAQPAAVVSEDGRWRWDGAQWQPVAQSAPQPAQQPDLL